MERLIAFVGNCQATSLRILFDRFIAPWTGDRAVSIPSYNQLSQSHQALIERADVIVEQVLEIAPKLKIDAEHSAEKVLVPLVAVGFLWPFAGQEHPRNRKTWFAPQGPFDRELGDSYLNRHIMQRTTPSEAIREYVDTDIAKTRNLARYYELWIDAQRRRDSLTGFSISDLIERHFRDEQLALTPHHPGLRLMMALASQCFERLKIPGELIERVTNCVRESPVPRHQLPIHPSVRTFFGLSYGSSAQKYRSIDGDWISLAEFAQRYIDYDWSECLAEGVALAASDPSQAIQKLRLAIAQRPSSAEAHFALGSALVRAGAVEEARRHFETAVELEPTAGRFHFALGDSLSRLKRFSDALPSLEAAVELDPSNQQLFVVMGRAYLNQGHTDQASEAAASATELAPNNPHSWILRSDISLVQGDVQSAVLNSKAALHFSPEDRALRLHYARSVFRLGGLAEAEQILKELMAEDESDTATLLLLSHVLRAKRNTKGSIMTALKAVLIDPRCSEAYSLLSTTFENDNNMAAAAISAIAGVGLSGSTTFEAECRAKAICRQLLDVMAD